VTPFRLLRRAPRLEPIFAVALLLALAASATTGCDPNALAPLLPPTGAVLPPPPPGACTSDFTTIQMVGDFTTPPFNIPVSPQMTEADTGCVWTVTVTLNAGTVLFKFVTDGDFDTTPDYGGDEAISLPVPGGPHATELVTGTGTAIKLTVAATGDYVFTLNERTLTWTAEAGAPPVPGAIAGTVSFANLGSAPYPLATVIVYEGAVAIDSTTTDPTTRAFNIGNLPAGTYRVLVRASCFMTLELPTVPVSGATTDVGDVSLAEGASAFMTIDVVGGFNFFVPGADPMIELPACVWSRDITLPAAVYDIKFLTDGVYDTPPDYGDDTDDVIDIPGGGLVRPVTGGNNIRISIANPGTYRFELDERLQRWSATLVSPAPSPAEGR
jgi:hypothetical protein